MGILKTIKTRWQKTMPKFFAVICWVGVLISSTALTVNEAMSVAGAVAPDWWVAIYPYLVGMPAAAAAVAKCTRTYDDENEKVVKKNENENDN
jgi:hypothetical protein